MDDWAEQQARFGALTIGEAARQAPKKKKKNFFLDQISTVGGIAGGIAGLPLGIFGAAGGAAGGSALGEAIENAISGESLGKNVIKEGAIGGVLGAGPIKLAKAGVGLATAGRAGGRALAGEATEQVARSATERGTQKLLGGAWGLKTGAKVGSETLTPQSAAKLQQFVAKEVGVPRTASADMVAERLVNFRKLSGANIDDIIKTADRTLAPAEKTALLGSINARVGKLVGVDTTSKSAQTLLRQAQEPKSISELVQFRRGLDDAINFSRNPASPDPITERLARAIRGEIDKTTSKLVPGLKTANTQYSQASKALDFVLPRAKTPGGVGLPFVSRGPAVGGTIGQRARAGVGSLVPEGQLARGGVTRQAGIGPRATQAPSTLAGFGGLTNRGVASRVGAGGLLGVGNPPSPQPNNLEDALLETQGLDGELAPNPDALGQATEQQSPYSRENLLADMQRDPKNADKYIAYFQSLQEIFAPANSLELNNTAIGTITDLQTGLDNLGLLEQEIGKSSGNIPVVGGVLSKIPGSPSKRLRADIDRVKQVIGKALEGGVLRKEDEEKYKRILPTVNDTDEDARLKIAGIRQDLQNKLRSFLANQNQFSGGGNTLEDAILTSQAQLGGYR